jgi:hypothetical protein
MGVAKLILSGGAVRFSRIAILTGLSSDFDVSVGRHDHDFPDSRLRIEAFGGFGCQRADAGASSGRRASYRLAGSIFKGKN